MGVAYVPRGTTLPPVLVCGATNHATAVAGPVPTTHANRNVDAYVFFF